MSTNPEPEVLTMWRARRAGGRITIYARGANGRDRKITNVDEIVGDSTGGQSACVTAVDKDGVRYVLA